MTLVAYNNIIELLPGKVTKLSNIECKCRCISPYHRDDTPSLHFTDTSEKVLIHCFGCSGSAETILGALGLPVGALYDSYWTGERKTTESKEDLQSTTKRYLSDFSGNRPKIKKFRKAKTEHEQIEVCRKLKQVFGTQIEVYKNDTNKLDLFYNDFELLYNLI